MKIMAVCFGGMKTTALCLILAIGSTFSRPPDFSLSECEEDHECSENEFCYDMKSCVTCYSCASYYRKEHAWKTCSRKPTECGQCMDGYKADILTNGEERDYCIAVEKEPVASPSGAAASLNFATLLIIGTVFATTAVITAVFLIHYWRKTRFRSDQQAVQDIQQPSQAGSGNGLSPLLGSAHERQSSVGERLPCDRPSAPPPPPSYEDYAQPLRTEAKSAPEAVEKCKVTVCFKESDFPFTSSVTEEEDQQSNDEPDTEAVLPPGYHPETGWPLAVHNDETADAWTEEAEEAAEQSEVTMSLNTNALCFVGAIVSTGTCNDCVESCEASDSGMSQASSSVSLDSNGVLPLNECDIQAVKRPNLVCGFSSSSDNLQDNEENCRSEQHPTKRVRQISEDSEETAALHAEAPSFHGILLSFKVPNDSSETHQCSDSGVSQASSTVSLNSSVGMSQNQHGMPGGKRQKLDSDVSSRSEDHQENEENFKSHGNFKNDANIIIVVNVQNGKF